MNASSIEEVLIDSECALLITEWDEFKKLDSDDFKKYMRTPNLVDEKIPLVIFGLPIDFSKDFNVSRIR
ncbi:MAG: hypothetical protein ACFFG0_11805 [Candidatus Thorarchaeota archaeon]